MLDDNVWGIRITKVRVGSVLNPERLSDVASEESVTDLPEPLKPSELQTGPGVIDEAFRASCYGEALAAISRYISEDLVSPPSAETLEFLGHALGRQEEMAAGIDLASAVEPVPAIVADPERREQGLVREGRDIAPGALRNRRSQRDHAARAVPSRIARGVRPRQRQEGLDPVS